jgi:hypothetical protein
VTPAEKRNEKKRKKREAARRFGDSERDVAPQVEKGGGTVACPLRDRGWMGKGAKAKPSVERF